MLTVLKWDDHTQVDNIDASISPQLSLDQGSELRNNQMLIKLGEDCIKSSRQFFLKFCVSAEESMTNTFLCPFLFRRAPSGSRASREEGKGWPNGDQIPNPKPFNPRCKDIGILCAF